MSGKETPTRELILVLLENFLLMFMIASGVGFTLRSLNLVGGGTDLYVFTMVFSTVWGLTGLGYAWQRERSDVRIPKLFTDILASFGFNGESRGTEFVRRRLVNFSRRIFLPGVQSPSCHA